VEIICQLDATDGFFIADLTAYSTCFGHHYAHHQELKEYYTGGCCLWYLVLWFSNCWSGVEVWVVCPVCGMLLYNTLELLMMSIMVPETCWASNKTCNKEIIYCI